MATGAAGGHAAPQEAGAADLRLGSALVGRVRDGGGTRRARRRVGGRAQLVLPLSIAISALLAIVFSRTGRRFSRTRPRAARTSSPRRTSGRSRASSPRPLSSRTTSSRSPSRSPQAFWRSPRRSSSLRGTSSGSRSRSSLLITLANLRGVRESGIAFAIPTYAFVASIFVLVGVGLGAVRDERRAPAADPSRSRPASARSRSSSCSARLPRARPR